MDLNRTQLNEAVWAHHVPMLRLAMSILRHAQNAEDAVSQAVILAYQKAHTLREEAAVKQWLLTITARCCYDMLRRSKRELLVNELPEASSPFLEPLGGTVLEKLSRLPAQQAQVLTLYYYENFSAAEIAQVLGIPRATVSMRMSRGRRRLKELLMEEEREEQLR